MWMLLLIGIGALVFLWSKKTFSYFSRMGFPQDPGYFPFGSLTSWQMMVGKRTFRDMGKACYVGFPEARAVGHYGFLGQKLLVIRDIELAKRIMIKDFDHFTDLRPFTMDKEVNKYVVNMLTMLKGEKWKMMRKLVSPVFTSGKLKVMVPLVHRIGDDLEEHLGKLSAKGEAFEAKELMTSFGLDTISTTGFGVEPHSFKDPDNPFTDATLKLIGIGKHKLSVIGFIRLMLIWILPDVAKFFKAPILDPEAAEFVTNVIKRTIQERQTSGKVRSDFIDMMTIALKDSDKNEALEEDQFERDAEILDVDNTKAAAAAAVFTKEKFETVLISNLFLLFFAGFDTTSTTLCMTLYYLAANPNVQEKLYKEIRAALEANNDSPHLDYDSIQSIDYMEMCILESMRMWPIVILERLCVEDYKIPDTTLTIEKGMIVQIPGPDIMKDPEHFPNPEEFLPENFSPEAKNKRGPYPFMGFGHGPRNCIGRRFALLAMKIALLRLVGHYKLSLSEKMNKQLIESSIGINQLPKGGVWLTVEKRA